MKKPLFVFDWDGVIFRTHILKDVTAKSLAGHGYIDSEVRAAAAKTAASRAGYTLANHAKMITKGDALSARRAEKAMLGAIEKHPGDFLFPDAKRTISALRKNGYRADVLTAGTKQFQTYKVKRSGARSFFKMVHIVPSGSSAPSSKLKILKKLNKLHKQIIFLDDRPDMIEAASKARLDGILPILVWRKKDAPPKGFLVVRRLSWPELKKIAIHKGFQP